MWKTAVQKIKNHRGNGIFPAEMKWKMFPAKIKYYPRNQIFPAEIKYSPRKWNVAIFPAAEKIFPAAKNIPRGPENIPRGNACNNIPRGRENIPRGPENIPRGRKNIPRGKKYSPRPRKYSPRLKNILSYVPPRLPYLCDITTARHILREICCSFFESLLTHLSLVPHIDGLVQDHYNDVIMGPMASEITNLTIVYSTVYLGADQRKHQSSASLAFVQGIHRWPVKSSHRWSVTRKMSPFDDVIML